MQTVRTSTLRRTSLPAPFDMFSPFNVMPDGLRTGSACRAYVIGRRPQMPAVKLILQFRESRKQLPGCRTLQNLYGIGNRQRRRDGYEQMDMVRLDFQGQNRPLALCANRVDGKTQRLGYFTCKYPLAILRAPYHMVCCLVHAISIVYNFYHVSNFIAW